MLSWWPKFLRLNLQKNALFQKWNTYIEISILRVVAKTAGKRWKSKSWKFYICHFNFFKKHQSASVVSVWQEHEANGSEFGWEPSGQCWQCRITQNVFAWRNDSQSGIGDVSFCHRTRMNTMSIQGNNNNNTRTPKRGSFPEPIVSRANELQLDLPVLTGTISPRTIIWSKRASSPGSDPDRTRLLTNEIICSMSNNYMLTHRLPTTGRICTQRCR